MLYDTPMSGDIVYFDLETQRTANDAGIIGNAALALDSLGT